MKLTERQVGDVLVLTVKGAPYLRDIMTERAKKGSRRILVNLEHAKMHIGSAEEIGACLITAADHGVHLKYFCGDNQIAGAVVFAYGLLAHHRPGTDEYQKFKSEAEAIDSFAESV